MNIFDFHLHPGYDFNGVSLTEVQFVERLKKSGIGFCAGSVIREGDRSRPLGDYAEIIPDLTPKPTDFMKASRIFIPPAYTFIPILSSFPAMR